MSQQLVTCLIAVAANLAGMLVIYSMLSYSIARTAWHGRGGIAVIALIAVAQLFWIAPALWIVEARGANGAGSCALWLGNWLVCGFSIVVFRKSATRIPVALDDAARMDGLGGFASWRHTVLPFVRRDLVLIAAFTVMATLLPFWGVINLPDGNLVTIFERSSSFAEHLARMVAASVLGAIPLVAIFFAVKRAA
jgi:multiple sugar transport system permease protein